MTQGAASSAAATRRSGDRATADAGRARQAAPGSRVAAVFGPGGHFLVAALVRLLGRQIVRGARDADLHIEDEAAVDEGVAVVPPHPVFYSTKCRGSHSTVNDSTWQYRMTQPPSSRPRAKNPSEPSA